MLGVPVQGGPSTLNPSRNDGTHGASWRMVVDLGPEVRAWSTYPGGQSGNPVSKHYTDRIEKWSRGELEEVLFPKKPEDLPTDRIASVLVCRPER
jgi:penicillin amidase